MERLKSVASNVMWQTKLISILLSMTLLLGVGGCVIKPQEADQQRVALDRNAGRYGYETGAKLAATRPVAEIPDQPTWRDVLERALLTNGELEASFHEWVMAVERIDQAGTWPTQPVELGFEYMFSGERMKTFDRMTFSAGLMDASALPNKTYKNAEVAWRDAQAASERFRAAKFDVQMKVLQAWASYCLQAERVRIQEQNVSLLKLVSDTASSRVRAGGAQQQQLRADVELRLAENELRTSRAELEQQRATLNGMLNRAPQAPLNAPAQLPPARPIPNDDDALVAAGVANNAELSALGYDAEARKSAIGRAKLEYLPEINPMAAFTGSVSQSLGAAVVLPTQLPKIRAMVAESRADLRRVQAMARQGRADKSARFVMTLLALRDAERRGQVFSTEILPLAEQTVELARRSYAAGSATYLEVIDAQKTLLEVRVMLAEAWNSREQMLAELEALAGVDIETLPARPSTQPMELP